MKIKLPLPRPVRLLALLLLPLSATAADFFIQDNFADGERFLDKPAANSFAWHGSQAPETYKISPQGLSFTQGGPKINTHLVVYFAPANSPRVLGIGDTLVLTLRFTPINPGNNPGGFRIGLFNSSGSRVSSDLHRTTHKYFQDGTSYDGIAAVANLATVSTAPVKLINRVASNDPKAGLITNEIGFAPAGPGDIGGTFSALSSGTPYTARLTINRLSNTSQVEFELLNADDSPTGIAHRQTSPAFGSRIFDCFALGINNGATNTVDAIIIHGASIRHKIAPGE